MSDFCKLKTHKFVIPIEKPVEMEGGRVLIERLIHLFKVKNRLELATLIGVTAGTLSTWTTRKTIPYELLIRLNLAMGIPMEYLCFGQGDSIPNILKNAESTIPTYEYESVEVKQAELSTIAIFTIENGKLEKEDEFSADIAFFKKFKIIPAEDFSIYSESGLKFINTKETTITKGEYLFSVNNSHQIGEFKTLPDGKTYLMEEGEKHPVDLTVTTIKGKVVATLDTTS